MFWQSTTSRLEKLRRHHRPRDVRAQESLAYMQGVAHQCASMNADVCSKMPLRLMRRVDAADSVDRRAYTGRKISKQYRAYMDDGRAGVKVADFAASGSEVEEVTDHPLLDLLANPNPEFPGSQMSWLSFYMREATGKAYDMIVLGADGLPAMLYPLLAQYVEPEFDDNTGELMGFRYARAENFIADLDREDVAFYKHQISRFNPNDGEGPLAGVYAESDMLASNLLFDISMAHGGNQPNSVWTLKDINATDEQVRAVEKRIKSKHTGVVNMAKPVVTRGELTIQQLQWAERELQSLPKLEFYEKRVRRAFGHTESMDDSNASTFASAVVGYDHQYMGAAIGPRLNNDAAQKNTVYLEMFGLDPTVYCLVYDNPVVKDESVIAERTRADVASGVITINEARSERGLDPVDDESADVVRVNGQTLKSLDAAPAAPTLGGFTLNAPSVQEVKAAEPVVEVKEPFDLLPTLRKSVADNERTIWKQCDCGKRTKATDDIADDPIIEDIFEGAIEPVESAFEGIVGDMQDEVVQAAREGRESNFNQLKDQAATVLRDQMEDIVLDSVRATIEAAGQDVESMFDVVNQSALDFLDTHVIRVADDIASTTESMIRPAIERGLEQGLSIESEDIPAYRAERIARTEVQNAAQGGRYETLKEVGVESTNWVNAPGARESHRLIAARSPKKIGEPYVKAGEVIAGDKFDRDVFHPPGGPNCRCSIQAIFESDEE